MKKWTDEYPFNGKSSNVIISVDLWKTIIDEHNRLAELEDKIEQGKMIELGDRKPLMWGEYGDTVHCQHCGEDLMGGFELGDCETEIIQCPKCGGFVFGDIAEDYNEAKLKELQEQDNER